MQCWWWYFRWYRSIYQDIRSHHVNHDIWQYIPPYHCRTLLTAMIFISSSPGGAADILQAISSWSADTWYTTGSTERWRQGRLLPLTMSWLCVFSELHISYQLNANWHKSWYYLLFSIISAHLFLWKSLFLLSSLLLLFRRSNNEMTRARWTLVHLWIESGLIVQLNYNTLISA